MPKTVGIICRMQFLRGEKVKNGPLNGQHIHVEVYMQLANKRKGSSLTVMLTGELDHHNAADIRETLDSMLDGSVRELILDMSGVTFMDSSGIGIVLGRYRRMQERDGRLFLSGLGGSAEKILRMAGVLGLVERK